MRMNELPCLTGLSDTPSTHSSPLRLSISEPKASGRPRPCLSPVLSQAPTSTTEASVCGARHLRTGLGDRTQRYVGRQLALMEGIRLYPEIEYGKSRHSVDWLWVSDSAVILIECKAARLTLDAQAGGGSLSAVMHRYLGAARKQIDTTARLIHEGHPAFTAIPRDRPVIGLVTTAEQFYLAGTPFSGIDSSGEVSVTTLSPA